MESLQKAVQGYTDQRDWPLRPYALMVGAYSGLMLGVVRTGARRSLQLSARDLLLLGVATHKLSRIITKDAVTSPLRAPFTRYNENLGYGEVQEESRRDGVFGGVGDILSCNYCADPWVGAGLLSGLIWAPRVTRLLTELFTSIAAADFRHGIYEVLRTRANVLTLREDILEKRAS
jgi:hypothetical protein